MKIAVLTKIARQVEGEWIFLNVIKASTNTDKLYRFVRENKLPRTEKISDVDCVIEYGVIENIEVEELEENDATTV
jgi:hypothetical protein